MRHITEFYYENNYDNRAQRIIAVYKIGSFYLDYSQPYQKP
ncbi:hypothetical protein IRB23SM22_21610 [Alkalibacterium sp. s-m-22]